MGLRFVDSYHNPAPSKTRFTLMKQNPFTNPKFVHGKGIRILCVFSFWDVVLNCHEFAIYILAPLIYAIVYGCSDATIVLGAGGKLIIKELGLKLEKVDLDMLDT
ncbi:hypothetical protein DEO72_LG3g788 [Vigna unguiculata]|uniref:Uncharacterized protein n=1 Tax=Vigna unguiculata TaxID=3917 RepID=A0A4D6LCH9_VIGUN|nr:hypothetical protein DEO72_LG3g788 [Vigna unguiculata]